MSRILEWFAIPSSSELHFVRTFHCDPSALGHALKSMAHSFIELHKPFHYDKPVIHEEDVQYYSVCLRLLR